MNRPWSKEDETALLLTKVTRRPIGEWARAHKRTPRAAYLKLMRLRRDPALKPPEFSSATSPASPAAASPQAPAGRGTPGQS